MPLTLVVMALKMVDEAIDRFVNLSFQGSRSREEEKELRQLATALENEGFLYEKEQVTN